MDYKVSVLIVCYNQEKYIKKALESVLSQKVNFNYEIVVCDDCSSDRTFNILQEYKSKLGSKLNLIRNYKNLGITLNYKNGFKNCKGEYIAVLEGDDYWIQKSKLKRQVSFLESNRDCSLVFNKIVLDYGDEKINNLIYPFNDIRKKFSARELVRSNFIQNFSCCMYRKSSIRKLRESIYDMVVYDWMFNMAVAQFGLIGYIPNYMTSHRILKSGLWSGKSKMENLQMISKCIDQYDSFFKYKYRKEFSQNKQEVLQALRRLVMVNENG
ncbi:glycosyltransferase involved in cell wall biosynthesis [Clostridium acetobutylicum]|uniref:Glycosyltransferase n=1 Tax=Clostridium acetobutylicum (strain ATCC 824 / DSM 792 / JCM 1419 / IAM 19013 / LMG 5710 / NBRC 13948 / NRRL B-527 / VKM B-1787 / 2291 / W) TaxID=272562 RepID=Q97GM1_CLOAB|nr:MULTISPECIES: glycosyltransferase [Clostridium]AAK80301.1 Glycosyltransferase [Clostridium acetobutylicum ATCC 824]ADZ21396.1 Glycosyltransferase [Clostridium acetobutylicum EA 2018]AEI32293.1 glycosyltransferase [Clostridium acetobutylicum DSM 1731]AWV79278.1 glycosyltransferase [Clostridium acetobutylicum]MBC2394753.1 glycosyltransferase [Clostridium acetobutylicum]